MSDPGENKIDFVVDVIGAVLLGLFTSLAAFAAYEASLWGGNQATAYTSAINILGEANRELLRGVQDQAFDTTIWIEHMKAASAEKKAATAAAGSEGTGQADAANHDNAAQPAPAAAAAPEAEPDEEDEENMTREQRAALLAEELAYAEDEPFPKKLTKLLQSRRELVAAVKWSHEQHEKRTKKLPVKARLELATKLVDMFEKSEKLDADYATELENLGLTEADETELAAELDKNPAAKEKLEKIEKDGLATQEAIDSEMDKLAAPMFFESTAYTRSRESKFTTLLEKGNQTFLDGQKYNSDGDRFTLTTVFYTVAMFFAGLAAVIRRLSIKISFLSLGVAVCTVALWYMLKTPFA